MYLDERADTFFIMGQTKTGASLTRRSEDQLRTSNNGIRRVMKSRRKEVLLCIRIREVGTWANTVVFITVKVDKGP